MYENFVVPSLRSASKLRPQTRGILLDKMSKSLGGLRMPISVAEGNKRPHDPVQAIVAPGFKDKTRYTLYVSPGSQISHITTNKGNTKR